LGYCKNLSFTFLILLDFMSRNGNYLNKTYNAVKQDILTLVLKVNIVRTTEIYIKHNVLFAKKRFHFSLL